MLGLLLQTLWNSELSDCILEHVISEHFLLLMSRVTERLLLSLAPKLTAKMYLGKSWASNKEKHAYHMKSFFFPPEALYQQRCFQMELCMEPALPAFTAHYLPWTLGYAKHNAKRGWFSVASHVSDRHISVTLTTTYC